MPATLSRKPSPRAAAKPAKRSKPAKRAARSPRGSTPEPGDRSPGAAQRYLEVSRILVGAVPAGGKGVPEGALYDAVREGTSRRQFPGDTHRMWAEHVLSDLQRKGVLASEGLKPRVWRRG